MTQPTRTRPWWVLASILIVCTGFAIAQEVPLAPLPAALTNPGQPADVAIVELMLRQAGIAVSTQRLLRAENLDEYSTVIIVLGWSYKGLGSAGLADADEFARAEALLARAKELGIHVIGVHASGMAQRGVDAQRYIDLIAGQTDHLIVRRDGDEDGFFTRFATETGIPVTFIETAMELNGVFKEVFSAP